MSAPSEMQPLGLDDRSWDIVEGAIEGLEQSWATTPNPDLTPLVPPRPDPLRRRVLLELIRVDQEFRWQSGERKLLESYVDEWSELGQDREALAELLHAECLTRSVAGDLPSDEEIRSRFPDLASRVDLGAIAAEADSERGKGDRSAADLGPAEVDTAEPAALQTATTGQPASQSIVGQQIGRYEIRQLLGQGAMGAVYRAYDTMLDREVALKCPRFDEMDDSTLIQRFFREARSAAAVRHPNICPIYDIGEAEGTYYLTMALVEGQSLKDWLEGQEGGEWSADVRRGSQDVRRGSPDPAEGDAVTRPAHTPRDAIDIVRKLALALATVHKVGILHRDIKAANVMIDHDGEPILMDFGLARPEHSEAVAKLTSNGSLLGTPAYMSPEQATGETQKVDVRSDLYSLGVLLYQLVTGRMPFEGQLMKVLMAITTSDPPAPSTLEPTIDAELETICLKAIAKAPADRYQTAAEFAEVLAQYVGHASSVPETAASPTAEPFPDAVQPSSEVADRSSEVVEPSEEVVEPSEDAVERSPERSTPPTEGLPPSPPAEPSSDLSTTPPHRLPEPQGDLRSTPTAGSETRAEPAKPSPRILRSKRKLAACATAAAFLFFAGIVIYLTTGQGQLELTVNEPDITVKIDGQVQRIEINSPRDKIVITVPAGKHGLEVTKDGFTTRTTEFWIFRHGKKELAARLEPRIASKAHKSNSEKPLGSKTDIHVDAPLQGLEALRKRVRVNDSGDPTDPIVVALRTDLLDFHRQHAGTREAIEAAKLMTQMPWPVDALRREDIPEYELKAAGGGDADLAPPELVAVLGDSRLKHWTYVEAVAYSHDGSMLASGDMGGTVVIWDPNSGRQSERFSVGRHITDLAFSPDGETLAIAAPERREIVLFSLQTGEERTLKYPGTPDCITFSRTGDELISGGGVDLGKGPGQIIIWDATTGEHRTLEGDFEFVDAVVVSRDDGKLVCGTRGGEVILWELATGQRLRTLPARSSLIRSVALSPDGKTIAAAVASASGSPQTWRGCQVFDVQTGEERLAFETTNPAYSVVFGPDGKKLAAQARSHHYDISIYDPETGKELVSMEGNDSSVACLAFSPDGRWLAGGHSQGAVKLWDVATGGERLPDKFNGHRQRINTVVVSQDGRLIATGDEDGLVWLWDAGTARELVTLELDAEASAVHVLAFHPDGSGLAVGDNVGTTLWDIRTQKKIRLFPNSDSGGHALAFSPDGQFVAGHDYDPIRLWDVARGHLVRTFQGHTGHIYHMVFSPDGKTLASGDCDGLAILWDATTGAERLRIESGVEAVLSLAFSPDGQTLGTFGNGAKLWDVAGNPQPATIRGGGHTSSGAFSPDGSLLFLQHDRTLEVWEVGTGELIQTIEVLPHPWGGSISQIAVTPDGRHVVTANANGTAYVLRLDEFGRAEPAVEVEADPAQAAVVDPVERLGELASRVEANRRGDPSDEKVESLRDELLAFRREYAGSEEAIKAAKLMARLPWPLDALRREEIPEYELKAAGGGDADLAPPELVAVLGDSRLKHWGSLYSMAYSPDGKMLASGDSIGTVVIWDPKSGRQSKLFSLGSGITDLTFSPDGRTLAMAVPRRREIVLFSRETGEERILKCPGAPDCMPDCIAFGQTGDKLISGGGVDPDKGQIIIWDATTGTLEQNYEGALSFVDSVACSRDGQTLASGGSDGTIILWDAAAGEERQTLRAKSGCVHSVEFSPDGTLLAAAIAIHHRGRSSWTGFQVWDVESEEVKLEVKTSYPCCDLTFSSDGSKLAAQSSLPDRISIWNLATGEEIQTLQGDDSGIHCLAFSPDGRTLAAGTREGRVRLWEATTGKEQLPEGFTGHKEETNAIALSANGETIATGSSDGSVKLWDASTAGEIASLNYGSDTRVKALAFNPEGRILATGGSGNCRQLWDANKRKPLGMLGGMGDTLGLEFTPDGQTVAVAGSVVGAGYCLTLWDVGRRRLRQTLRGHTGVTCAIAFSPDGTTLASGGDDGLAILWDMATATQRHRIETGLDTIYSVAVSPDGRTLATLGNGAKLWDVGTGDPLSTAIRSGGTIASGAFSPDGSLVFLQHDRRLEVWEVGTDELVQTIEVWPHPWGGSINQVAVTSDGRHVVTANGNGTTYVLRLEELATAVSRNKRSD